MNIGTTTSSTCQPRVSVWMLTPVVMVNFLPLVFLKNSTQGHYSRCHRKWARWWPDICWSKRGDLHKCHCSPAHPVKLSEEDPLSMLDIAGLCRQCTPHERGVHSRRPTHISPGVPLSVTHTTPSCLAAQAFRIDSPPVPTVDVSGDSA